MINLQVIEQQCGRRSCELPKCVEGEQKRIEATAQLETALPGDMMSSGWSRSPFCRGNPLIGRR